MYPKIEPITGNIELIENSGVQFVDYDAMVDWECEDKLSHIKAIKKGRFFIDKSTDSLIRYAHKISDKIERFDPIKGPEKIVEYGTHDDEFEVELQKSLQLYDGVWFPIPYLNARLNGDDFGPINWARARIVKVEPKNIEQDIIKSYLKSKGLAREEFKSVQYGDASYNDDLVADTQDEVKPKEKKLVLPEGTDYYRIVLAFDTKTQEFMDNKEYQAPADRDAESTVTFDFAYQDSRTIKYLKGINGGKAWVSDWVGQVFSELYKERINGNISEQKLDDLKLNKKEHQAHYLNLLAFLGYVVGIAPVKLIQNRDFFGTGHIVDVSLVLDIGNARSCGIMVEQNNNVNSNDDNFSDTYPLLLRDLNTPEQVYNESFASRIEFAEPNFAYGNLSARSGRSDAFEWPSLVRVGQEASNLAALKSGNEGNTGLISPKRYLWSTDPFTKDRWVFNCYSYQVHSKFLRQEQRKKQSQNNRAHLDSVGMYFNTHGRAYFALDKDDTMLDNLDSRYSNNSTMTFMLIEIILHAMTQMNSLAQRNKTSFKNVPRRLKSIILTTPPCMSIEEKELYRACVYEALGILWKSMGFDKTYDNLHFCCLNESQLELMRAEGADNIPNIYPPVPEVHMDWDEAESGQVVYIYNEAQKTFSGHGNSFIQYLRRPMTGQRIGERLKDEDNDDLISARIASLDIGGGTSDLVIKDYSFKKGVSYSKGDIIPHDIFKDGFKIAGDDILHDIIKLCLLNRLAYPMAKRRIQYRPILNKLVGDSSGADAAAAMLRSQFTQQILVKVAYKIMFHLENLDPYAETCKVSGTVSDFILDKEVNHSLPKNVKRPGPYPKPSKEVINYVNDILSEALPNFSIMDFKLTFDIAKINRALLDGERFDICRILNKLCEVITTYNVDLLLLTGRASKIPAIRSYFLQRLNVPSSRIIAMHSYRCDTWYPFLQDGEVIGDPKTTAAVGALISYLRLDHTKFSTFKYNSKPSQKANSAHYVGVLDAKNNISDNAVLYKYESSVLLGQKDASMGKRVDIDKEGKFTKYNRSDDAFTTKLSVEIGYRLLDDPQVECNPLYKIEAYHKIDDIPALKKAALLTYEDLSDTEVEKLFDAVDSSVADKYRPQFFALRQKMNNLAHAYSPDIENNYISQLEAMFEEQVQSYIAQQKVEERVKGGLFGFGKDSKVAEEKQRLYDEYVATNKQSFMESSLQLFRYNLEQQNSIERSQIQDQMYELLNQAIDENLTLLRVKLANERKKLEPLLSERPDFNVELSVVTGTNSPYPVPFLQENVSGLPKVETFKLERVTDEQGTDYTRHFRMYLKSISGDNIEYFMDSGNISIQGINPRFVL